MSLKVFILEHTKKIREDDTMGEIIKCYPTRYSMEEWEFFPRSGKVIYNFELCRRYVTGDKAVQVELYISLERDAEKQDKDLFEAERELIKEEFEKDMKLIEELLEKYGKYVADPNWTKKELAELLLVEVYRLITGDAPDQDMIRDDREISFKTGDKEITIHVAFKERRILSRDEDYMVISWEEIPRW